MATLNGTTWTTGDLSLCPNGKRYTVCPLTYSITLTWDAPTLREDGSAIAGGEIVGYNISVDGSETVLGDVNTYVATSLTTGLHTFTLKTRNSEGTLSQTSTWEITI